MYTPPKDDDSSAGGFPYELVSKPHLDMEDLRPLGQLQKEQLSILRRSHREMMQRMLVPEWKRSLGKFLVLGGHLWLYALVAAFVAFLLFADKFPPVFAETLVLWLIPSVLFGGALIVWGNKLQGREMPS